MKPSTGHWDRHRRPALANRQTGRAAIIAAALAKAPLDLALNVGARISELCREDGVLIRNLADTFIISSLLTLTRANADEIVSAIDRAMRQVA